MSANKRKQDALLLAELYSIDELEPESDSDLFESLSLISNTSNPRVICQLGKCCHYGRGTVRDLRAAINCYVRAAGLDSVEALDQLYFLRNGQSMETDLQDAFRGFSEKSDQGDARAQLNAGYCHYWGIGTSEDSAKARDLFLKAADQGYADALEMLEECRIMVWRRMQGDAWNRSARICRKFGKRRGPISAGLRVLEWKNCVWPGGPQGQEAGSSVVPEGGRSKSHNGYKWSCCLLLHWRRSTN